MNAKNYIENTKNEVIGDHKDWIDDLILRMSRGGKIFEIGSATSRDANYIEESNHLIKVVRTDKELDFVEYIKTTGKEAFIFDILKDSFEENVKYEGFYSHMVINHFTLDEVKNIFDKIKKQTNKNGYISVSFPLGDNSTLTSWNSTPGNVFCRYHSIKEITETASKIGSFVYLKESEDKKMCYITMQV